VIQIDAAAVADITRYTPQSAKMLQDTIEAAKIEARDVRLEAVRVEAAIRALGAGNDAVIDAAMESVAEASKVEDALDAAYKASSATFWAAKTVADDVVREADEYEAWRSLG
jgi:hypothetical protein